MKRVREKGQVMLLSVLLISSAVLGAATIAGLLVLFQLRQTADAEASARAVFAADAGIERSLYEKYRNPTFTCDGIGNELRSPEGDFELSGNIEYLVRFNADCTIARSGGRAGRAARAFEIYMEGIENFGGQLD